VTEVSRRVLIVTWGCGTSTVTRASTTPLPSTTRGVILPMPDTRQLNWVWLSCEPDRRVTSVHGPSTAIVRSGSVSPAPLTVTVIVPLKRRPDADIVDTDTSRPPPQPEANSDVARTTSASFQRPSGLMQGEGRELMGWAWWPASPPAVDRSRS
jgi:hypothetical protein